MTLTIKDRVYNFMELGEGSTRYIVSVSNKKPYPDFVSRLVEEHEFFNIYEYKTIRIDGKSYGLLLNSPNEVKPK